MREFFAVLNEYPRTAFLMAVFLITVIELIWSRR